MKNTARPQDEELLTVGEAAKEAQVEEVTIRRHIEKGALLVVHRGPCHRIRITRSELERYLRS